MQLTLKLMDIDFTLEPTKAPNSEEEYIARAECVAHIYNTIFNSIEENANG